MNLLDEPQSSRPNTLRHSLSDRNKQIQIKPSWQISQNQGVNHNKNKKKCIEPCGDYERSCWKSSASWERAQKTRQYKENCWPGIYWSVSQGASYVLEGRAVTQRIQRGLALSTALRSSLLVHTAVIKTSPVLTKTFGCGRDKSFCFRCELKRNYVLPTDIRLFR